MGHYGTLLAVSGLDDTGHARLRTHAKLMHRELPKNDDAGILQLPNRSIGHRATGLKSSPGEVSQQAHRHCVAVKIEIVLDASGEAIQETKRPPLPIPSRRLRSGLEDSVDSDGQPSRGVVRRRGGSMAVAANQR